MRTVKLSTQALQQLHEWIQVQPRTAAKIVELIQEICRTPFEGKGKPEPLKHQLQGKWSRRITEEHRLVYGVNGDCIEIISCKFHYEEHP